MLNIPKWAKVEINGYSYDPTPMPVLTSLLLALELIPLLLIFLIGTLLKIDQIFNNIAFFGLAIQFLITDRKRLMIKFFGDYQINKLINSAGIADYRTNSRGQKIIVRSVILTFFFFENSGGIELKIDPNGIANSKKCAELAQDISLAFKCSAFLKKTDYNGYTYVLTYPIDYGVNEDEF
ncbi:Protein of unknown function [Lactobacillus equicursoris DSM 19284 = JCM 14600 = CIP 110162]|uniref:hypothetical protein n=1 Tax=Lactobacillus equicursoris TaxID=420645 RepID=UPI000283F290|nr:hypothetical protein [Lactobacillus equicursoris]CCK85290.1 Protein of unknown function [Lactobacillus equicursoris DSM 19284 = JCM 14600 = CIP 110162]